MLPGAKEPYSDSVIVWIFHVEDILPESDVTMMEAAAWEILKIASFSIIHKVLRYEVFIRLWDLYLLRKDTLPIMLMA